MGVQQGPGRAVAGAVGWTATPATRMTMRPPCHMTI
jgi:hypothetical protein